jgi:hypothetical protein
MRLKTILKILCKYSCLIHLGENSYMNTEKKMLILITKRRNKIFNLSEVNGICIYQKFINLKQSFVYNGFILRVLGNNI